MILCMINLLCYCLILFKRIKIQVTQTVVYETGITKPTLYRYLAPNGELRDYGIRVLLNSSAIKQPLTPAKFTVF
jgi:hypothetical protein